MIRLRLRINNKGMSLVELIISMAITAIILSMIIMLISGASHSFRRTNDKVNLQMESQIAINQLSTIVMGAKGISAITAPLPADKQYIIQGITGKDSYGVFYRDSDHKLFLIQKPTVASSDFATISEEDNLLAEYVSVFNIAITSKTASIDISFELGEDSYLVSRKVKIRNY